MKKRFLTTLAAGLVACAAAPALAGTIQLTNRADAGPVQVTFDEGDLAYGDSFGTINGATFPSPGLSADRDYTLTTTELAYNGFADFFGGGIVASNFIIPSSNLSPLHIKSVELTIEFADEVHQAGFDFVALPGQFFTVSLLERSATTGELALIGSSGRLYQTLLDGNDMPIVGFAGLRNLDGFDGLRINLADDQYFAMNDLRFGVAVVPLPPAAFMGLGLLAGIGIVRRLRRRSA